MMTLVKYILWPLELLLLLEFRRISLALSWEIKLLHMEKLFWI